jgi:AraC family transcriptional regulator of arabinose operon
MAHDIAQVPTAADSPSPPPGLLVAGHLTPCTRKIVLRRGGTRDWVLSFTIGGGAFFRQPGVEFEAHNGDLVLLKPHSYHHYGPLPGGWDCLWAHFIARPAWLSALSLPSAGKGIYRLHISNPKAHRQICRSLTRCVSFAKAIDSGFSQELAMNALEEAVYLAARENAYDGRERPLSPVIRRVLEHLGESYAEPQSLARLARLGGLSASRLTHIFKDETGDSIIAYLLKLRLRQGARLLEFSDRSVKEVAYEVGFKSPFYFSRQFHSFFAMSPKQYRQKVLRRK